MKGLMVLFMASVLGVVSWADEGMPSPQDDWTLYSRIAGGVTEQRVKIENWNQELKILYYPDGKIKEYFFSSDSPYSTQFIYNKSGTLSETNFGSLDENGKNREVFSKDTYQYNAKGQLVSIISSGDGEDIKKTCTVDPNGNYVFEECTEIDEIYTGCEYKKLSPSLQVLETNSYALEKGKKVLGVRLQYNYDAKGNLIKLAATVGPNLETENKLLKGEIVFSYTYDKKGNPLTLKAKKTPEEINYYVPAYSVNTLIFSYPLGN